MLVRFMVKASSNIEGGIHPAAYGSPGSTVGVVLEDLQPAAEHLAQ
jgi:hypothetical protein